jgi:hypothetical protein
VKKLHQHNQALQDELADKINKLLSTVASSHATVSTKHAPGMLKTIAIFASVLLVCRRGLVNVFGYCHV